MAVMSMKSVYLGSDHAGFELKKAIYEMLKAEGYKVTDVGPHEFNPGDDYPDYVVAVCKEVKKNDALGILICGSGQGMAIAANKINGIYAAVCWNEASAKYARASDGANVLCLGGRTMLQDTAEKAVDIWLGTAVSKEERHIRRMNKVKEIERSQTSTTT